MKPGSESTAKVIPLGPALRVSSDARLARLAAGGNRAAFAAIFDRYHQELFRYCVSIVHDQEDAADALQSTMLRALRALEGDDRDVAVRPWLYRIAHNESISLLRRRSQAAAEPAAPAMAVLDVEGSAAVKARLETVLEDMRTLPERQRAALAMRELSGLSYSEIAAALETSPAGAKQAVYDARRALLELAKGRDETCETIRHRISAGDRRVTRARVVRAHLRACADCRLFQAQIADRERALAGLAPVLPAAAAAHVLKGALVGTGGTSAEGVLFGVGTTAVGKAATTLAVTVALGAGVAGVELADRGDARGDSAANGPSAALAPDQARDTRGARHERSAPAESARRTSGAPARRSGGDPARSSGTKGKTRDDYKRRSAWEPPVDRGAATVAVPGGSAPAAAPRPRGGRLGLRPGTADGDGSSERGPIGTGVDELRDTVSETVEGAVGPLPTVKPPKLPIRERRR